MTRSPLARKTPRIADLFCGAGGAAMGLHRAGFEVVGFDHIAQPHYPFEFHQADALTVDLSDFDAVWASLQAVVMLCGTAFGLGVRDRTLVRHRYFETNWPVMAPPCQHDRRKTAIGVYGHAGGSSARSGWRNGSTADWRIAMGIDWMTGAELAEAIPPAYSEYLGAQLLRHLA